MSAPPGGRAGDGPTVPVLVDLQLPPARTSAGAARQAIEGLGLRVPVTLMDSLRLLVSELVTNSFRHGRLRPTQWIGLRVRLTRAAIRVEVSDAGPGFEPSVPTPTFYQESGWGLYLVDRIADRWGILREDRATVWFEIDLAAGSWPPQDVQTANRTWSTSPSRIT